MLTSEMGIAAFDLRRGEFHPDRLRQQTHSHYLTLAERMLQVYRQGVGRTRRDLHREIGNLFQEVDDCPPRRIDAFCKLLDDASEFTSDKKGQAAQLRREVFRRAATYHPLVSSADRLFESQEDAIKAKIAKELDRPWEWISSHLFDDVIDFHRLSQFHDYVDGRALLARYNVAQVQVALFRAEHLTVWAGEDLKTIVRYAKLARLMHTINRSSEHEYRLRFDGPTSVLRETRRYGVAMARFLPGLLSCRQWRAQAAIRAPFGKLRLRLTLSSRDRLRSSIPAPAEFDSSLESAFAEKWGDAPRDGWSLSRESELLVRGQKIFVPDFALQHESGRRVLLEIVGFWTPEYLRAKYETLQTFPEHPILLAVAESAHHQLPPLPSAPLLFKTSLRPAAVLERLGCNPPADN